MGDPLELFQILFETEAIYGYVGVLIIISISIVVCQKNRFLGWFFVVFQMILMVDYLGMIAASGFFSLHAVLLMGSVLTCMFVMIQGH